MLTRSQEELLEAVQAVAQDAGVTLYLVGGVVRDIFLAHDLQDKDLDFLLVGNALIFARRCVKQLGGALTEFDEFLTAKISSPAHFPSIQEIDLASARLELYPQPGALPEVRPALKLEDDLQRRDFTINAMALPLKGLLEWLHGDDHRLEELYRLVTDLYGGRADLQRGVVRVLHDRSFIDDPTRIMRACRYAARLAGSIEPHTLKLLRSAVEHRALGTISPFRRLTEVRKIMEESRPFEALKLMTELGVLDALGLSRPETEAELLGALERLCALPLAEPQPRRYDAALLVFARFLGERQAQDVFKRMSIGRAKIERILDELNQSLTALETAKAPVLPELVLIGALVWQEHASLVPQLELAARARGILRAG